MRRIEQRRRIVVWAVVIVVLMNILDLNLTIGKCLKEKDFVDENIIAQFMLDLHDVHGITIMALAKLAAVAFFVIACLRARDALITEVGVIAAAVFYGLATFHWILIY